MASSVSGLGSGIDFSQLTDSIVAQQSRPVSLLQSKSSELTNRSDALKQLNAKLATLTDAANALTSQDLGSGRIANSSASSYVSVSANSTAGLGTINLSVTRLATSLTQISRVFTAPSDGVLAGGATSATFELRKGGATTGTAITINALNNSLTGLRDAINQAGAGVTATIVDTDGSGTQNKLVLNSSATGSAGRVELVETTATGSGAALTLTSSNPPGATTDFSGLDASFSINGVSLNRSSNTVDDALTGLTLNLKDIGTAKITVSAGTSDVETKIRSFITAYNSVQDFIAGQNTKDSSGRVSGVLAADSTLRSVQQQLRQALAGTSTDNGGALDNLTQIGIGRDENGKLKLDSAVLSDKLTNSFDDVRALLAGKTSGKTGIANQIYNTYNKLSDSIIGTVQNAIDGYQSSIKNLSKSINNQLSRIALLKSSLTRQFATVDAAINQLNGQGTTLTSILNSLNGNSKSNN